MAAILAGVQDGEEIIRGLGLEAMEFSQTITVLEIKGVVKPLGMSKWIVRE